MSTSAVGTRPVWRARPDRRRGPVARTAWSLLTWFTPIAAIFWLIVLVVVVAVPFLVDAVAQVELSIVWQARQSGIWFPFSVLISVAVTYPTVHLANGMTRRSYVRGVLVAVSVLAVAFAVMMTLALLAERTWYGAMGWSWQLQGDWFAPAEGMGTVLVSYLATYLVAYLSGLLVGTVYGAAGGWWGTLTLPLTVGPIILVTILVDNQYDWVPFSHLFGEAPSGGTPLALVVTAAAVLALALATAFWLVASRRPVAPRRA